MSTIFVFNKLSTTTRQQLSPAESKLIESKGELNNSSIPLNPNDGNGEDWNAIGLGLN